MRAWIQVDDQGREFLTRVGSGVVLSVTPVGDPSPIESEPGFVRIAILVDAMRGSSNAVRFQATAITRSDDPVLVIAREAITADASYQWTIEWHRHDYVPGDLPIATLDLARDTRAFLVDLMPSELVEVEGATTQSAVGADDH